ncbi:MAG: Ig-like domain repeat protein [Solirubrobacterales bacterium]
MLAFFPLSATTAHAANYKMVLCAGNNGSNSFDTATNTVSGSNPSGIFDFTNVCGPAPDPAGNNAFLRIAENQSSGDAGETAYGSISWTVPPWVAILAGGGYTREPNAFNDGWRGRFWAEDFGGGGPYNILMQGAGLPNQDIFWAPTSTFAPHLWPFSSYGYYRRFIFELTCMRQAGCDRTNFNAVDANSFVLILADVSPSQVWLTNTGAPFLGGQWVRGTQVVTYAWSDVGSGIRMERVRIDGADRFTIDHAGECDTGYSQQNGEFARVFSPCAQAAGIGRSYTFDTASLADGPHTAQACTQDYAQWKGLDGTGSESCDQRTIRTDNTAPAKPAALEVTSANPARYLTHFGARWSLPTDSGSPITNVHYDVIDAAGNVVSPAQTLSATNPVELKDVAGPAQSGDYRLRVWLEDQVGYSGPAATAPIPHDTTPPAAPQDLHVSGPTTAHRVDKLDLRWRDITDSGSPINAAHYQVVDSSGAVAIPTQTVSGENVEAINGVQTPSQRGDYTLRVWLSDQEGNVGAAANVPLPRDTTPPAAPQDVSVAAPSASRAAEGLDVHWRNIVDAGSPIDAAHYEVMNGAGAVVVPAKTVDGTNVEAISNLETPSERGSYALRLWLSDAEGNVGAPVTVPLAYECVRSEAGGGAALATAMGSGSSDSEIVREGSGSVLHGTLRGSNGTGIAAARLCVFSRVVTDQAREFLGLAVSAQDGGYRFPVPAGASRDLTVVYRGDHREVTGHATIETIVHPLLQAKSKVIYNKHFAHFYGAIPGPHNDRVVVVLQAKVAKGWTAFRRYRTRENGRFSLAYRFRRTFRRTTYAMRAQVRQTVGYPYLQGNSDQLTLLVLPRSKRK